MDIIVDNAAQGWRWYSVLFPGAAGILQALYLAVEASWIALPPDLKASLDPTWITVISIALVVMGVIGRFIKQPIETEKPIEQAS